MHSRHVHVRTSERRRLLLVLGINAAFLAAEVVGAVVGHSVALLADAGHLAADVTAVSLALLALWLAERPQRGGHTYGYARAEILAAFANGLGLLAIAGYVTFEAAGRLAAGPEVNSPLVLGVAAAGLVGNLTGAWILHRHAGHSLNVRGAFLHLLGDSMASAAVVASALVVMATGWNAADPVAAIVIAGLIVVAGGRLVLETARVLMEAAPRRVDLPGLVEQLLAVPGVESAHDLHVWTVTSDCLAISVHVRRSTDAEAADVLARVRERLETAYGVHHLTVQIEEPRRPDERVDLEGEPGYPA